MDAQDATPHRWLTWFRNERERAIFSEIGFHAVVCAGQEGLQAVRLFATGDPRRQLSLMQIDAWRTLKLHDIVWCQDAKLADRLKFEACLILDDAARRLRGDWFDCPPALAVQVVRLAVKRSGVPILTHPQMLARVRDVRERRIQRAMCP